MIALAIVAIIPLLLIVHAISALIASIIDISQKLLTSTPALTQI